MMLNTIGMERGTEEYAFVEYVKAWQKRQFKRMALFTNVSWRMRQKNPGVTLEQMYHDLRLIEYEIVKVDREPDAIGPVALAAVDITFTGKFIVNGLEQVNQVRARVLRESAAGKLLPKDASEGMWGVNPISTLRRMSA